MVQQRLMMTVAGAQLLPGRDDPTVVTIVITA
jgi:hypothetical protein